MRDEPKEHRMLVKKLATAQERMGDAVSILREARDPRALAEADKIEDLMHSLARLREDAEGKRR